MINDAKVLKSMVIGVISDTHGSLLPNAVAALRGADHIIHAGDVVDADVVRELQRMAPLTAVHGNMDRDELSDTLPNTAAVTVGGLSIYVLHDIGRLDLDPKAAEFDVVVHGHTHSADIEWQDGVLFLNPGSAGPPRGRKRPSIALLKISGRKLTPEIVFFEDGWD